MKKLILNSIGLSLLLCSTIYLNAKNHTLPLKKNSVYKSVCETKDCKIEKCTTILEFDVRVDQGQRSQCGPKDKTVCCGNKCCFIVVINKPDPIPPMMTPSIFEGTISQINEHTFAFKIPFNKILPQTYTNWFTNDIFEGEYFPLDNSIAEKFGLKNIALSLGNYPVKKTDTGYLIEVNFQQQTGE
ncbi:MAG: hypothetical protein WCO28_09925 [Bacteroidota bacterium]